MTRPGTVGRDGTMRLFYGLPLPAGALYRMNAGRLLREGILGAGRSAERRAAAGAEAR